MCGSMCKYTFPFKARLYLNQESKSDFDLLEDKCLTIQHKFLKSEIAEIDFCRDDSLRTPMILLPSTTSENYFFKEQYSKNYPKGTQQVKKTYAQKYLQKFGKKTESLLVFQQRPLSHSPLPIH